MLIKGTIVRNTIVRGTASVPYFEPFTIDYLVVGSGGGGGSRGGGGVVTSAGGYTYHTFTASGTYQA